MSKLTVEAICEAMDKAADWIEANPDKVIMGALAENEDGDSVLANSEEATCWCALGRVAKELNMSTEWTSFVVTSLEESFLAKDKFVSFRAVHRENDRGIVTGLDRVAGAKALRRIKQEAC